MEPTDSTRSAYMNEKDLSSLPPACEAEQAGAVATSAVAMGMGAEEPKKVRKPRGFAAMDPTRVAEIARKGGRAAHEAGTAHRFSANEARDAGKKGGLAPHKSRGRSA